MLPRLDDMRVEHLEYIMASVIKRIIKRCRGSSTRTFIIYPIAVVFLDLAINEGRLDVAPIFLLLMVWGYLQYRLCGLYRIKHGGGGPGMDTPPDSLVTGGPFAYSRNPMYMGHIIFLAGLGLSFHSWLAAAMLVYSFYYFQARVRRDEQGLIGRFGTAYIAYMNKVNRWVPGFF